MLELPDAKSLLHLAGLSPDADKVDTSLITEALSRHTQSLKERRREAVVKAESEVLKMSGDLNAHVDATGQAVSSVDNTQLLAAVEASIARSEQRMQAFVRDELRRAIITITKLEVPVDAPPPPQFSAQQFRCDFGPLPPGSCCHHKSGRFIILTRGPLPMQAAIYAR